MNRYRRSAWQRRRDQQREYENAWIECPVAGHGGYNPWQITLGGMRRGGCPKCAAERYEALKRQ